MFSVEEICAKLYFLRQEHFVCALQSLGGNILTNLLVTCQLFETRIFHRSISDLIKFLSWVLAGKSWEEGKRLEKINAMWRMQGITDSSPTIYLNVLTTTLIHYFGACFARSLLLKWFSCPIRASGVRKGNIYVCIFHSEMFLTWFDLA